MRKNNAKNPIANFAALTTLLIVAKSVKKMIKKYHKRQEIFY